MRYLITTISLFGLMSCICGGDEDGYLTPDCGQFVGAITIDFISGEEVPSIVGSKDIVFGYDDQQRLTTIRSTGDKDVTITYHSDMIVETSSSNSITTGGVDIKHRLNGDGVVIDGAKLRKEHLNGEAFEFPKTYSLIYNDNGCVTNKSITTYNSDEPIITTYVWSGGNLTKKSSEESYRGSDGSNLKDIVFLYGDGINSSNLDINVITSGSWHSLTDVPSLIRKEGGSSKNLISQMVDRHDMPSDFWNETKYIFEYTYSPKGHVTKIERYFSFRYSSQQAASNEFLDAIYTITYLDML